MNCFVPSSYSVVRVGASVTEEEEAARTATAA